MYKPPPPKLAPNAAGSRSDPKPNFSLSKEWIPEPRAKPGRKKAVAGSVGEADTKKAAQKAIKEQQKNYILELENKLSIAQRERLDYELFCSQHSQQNAELRLENEGLRDIIRTQRVELDTYRKGYSGAGSVRGAPTDQPEGLPNSKRSRLSSNSIYNTSPILEQDLPSPVSSLGRAYESLSPLVIAAESNCGLCSSDTTNCFCADAGYSIDHSKPSANFQSAFLSSTSVPSTTSSIALPLRSRVASGKPSIWHLDHDAPAAPPNGNFKCSGNPNSCGACKDDPFGKAFCASLSDAVCSTNPCDNCPRSRPALISPDIFQKTLADLPCCGDAELCGSLTCKPNIDNILPLSVPAGVRSMETVPCNEAWEALKVHPNIGFADLRMLADVVSKRTFCDGPIESLSSASGGSSEQYMLVPHQTLVCAADAGRRKRLTVEREAVNDALGILDRAVGRGGPLMK